MAADSEVPDEESSPITNPGKSVNWLLLVITISLCQTSCLLRTVHFILFRNRRDELQTLTVAKQIFGTKASNFIEAYYQRTADLFSYVLIAIQAR